MKFYGGSQTISDKMAEELGGEYAILKNLLGVHFQKSSPGFLKVDA